jgi:hypothetical protein
MSESIIGKSGAVIEKRVMDGSDGIRKLLFCFLASILSQNKAHIEIRDDLKILSDGQSNYSTLLQKVHDCLQ